METQTIMMVATPRSKAAHGVLLRLKPQLLVAAAAAAAVAVAAVTVSHPGHSGLCSVSAARSLCWDGFVGLGKALEVQTAESFFPSIDVELVASSFGTVTYSVSPALPTHMLRFSVNNERVSGGLLR